MDFALQGTMKQASDCFVVFRTLAHQLASRGCESILMTTLDETMEVNVDCTIDPLNKQFTEFILDCLPVSATLLLVVPFCLSSMLLRNTRGRNIQHSLTISRS